MTEHEKNVFTLLILCIMLFIESVVSYFYYNVSAEHYLQAEQACVSTGSHVVEFDRSGEAICENNATIDYVVFMKEISNDR